jgi:Tol biopolymer transport system component
MRRECLKPFTRSVLSALVVLAASLLGGSAVIAAPGDIVLASTSDIGVKADSDSGAVRRSLSADGTTVAFISTATNLDPAATDGVAQVYVKDLSTGNVTLASVTDSGDSVSNLGIWFVTLSPNGTKVAFITYEYDVWVKDLITGELTIGSSSADGEQSDGWSWGASFSADGSKLAFTSSGSNLDPDYTNLSTDQVFVKDLSTGEVSLVSATDSGDIANYPGVYYGDPPSMSADGTKVAFTAQSTNLDPAATQPFAYEIFVKDLATGQVALASASNTGIAANDWSLTASLSADGTKVVFTSLATNLDPAASDGIYEIYVKDLPTGSLTLASGSNSGIAANSASDEASISSDGARVAFTSPATNLDPAHTDPSTVQAFVKDLSSGEVSLASTSNAGVVGNDHSAGASLSADGTKVAFSSAATNLDPSDTDGYWDVFVKELAPAPPVCTITGTGGSDVLKGTMEDDVICGLGDTDTLRGVGGDDILFGGPGNDVIGGGAGADILYGGWGKDTLRTRDGISGNDTADGGVGTDMCKIDVGDVVISCL